MKKRDFLTKTTHQNTAFSPLFCKKRKDGFRNKLNISALHFCIFAFCILFPLNAWILEIFYYFLSDTNR